MGWTLTIREIALSDAESAAQLSGELGYPVSKEIIERRIAASQMRDDRGILVASVNDAVVAWIDLGIIHHLQSEPYGEIGGLVVSERFRSAGIGKQLIARAEEWMRQRGLRRALVRSQISRDPAHRFYLREGYVRTKTSAVFEKDLSSE